MSLLDSMLIPIPLICFAAALLVLVARQGSPESISRRQAVTLSIVFALLGALSFKVAATIVQTQ